MALSEKNRISRDGIRTVLKRGKTVQCSFFFVRVVHRRDSPGTFGVVVSSKIVPKATERNRIRRILTETARLQIGTLMGYDVVCVLTRPVRNEETARKELVHAFKKR